MTEYVVENGKLVSIEAGQLKRGRTGRRPPLSERSAAETSPVRVTVVIHPGICHEAREYNVPIKLTSSGQVMGMFASNENVDSDNLAAQMLTPAGIQLIRLRLQDAPGLEGIQVMEYAFVVQMNTCFDVDEAHERTMRTIWQVSGYDPEQVLVIMHGGRSQLPTPIGQNEPSGPQAGTNPEAGASA